MNKKNFFSENIDKAVVLSTALFLAVVLAGCSQKELAQSSWQSTAVHVDGDASEWEIPLKLYDEATQLSYSLSNDDQNIYVCIRAANEKTQQQIIRGGMQLWIDSTGKKDQHAGIRYPSPDFQKPTENSGRSTTGEKQDKDSKSLHERFLSQDHQMIATGFLSPVSNGPMPLQNVYGLKVSINWDSSGVLVYEAAIPLKLICESPFSSLKKNKKRTFGFSITTNVMPVQTHNSSSGRGHQSSGEGGESSGGFGGGGRHGGGGMHGGGMHGGGGGGRGSESSAEENEPKTFWMQFQLADKK